MQISIVGSYPPPHGGQSVHIQNLARFLRSCGDDVRIFNTGSNKSIAGEGVLNVKSSLDLLWQTLRRAEGIVHLHVATPVDLNKLLPAGAAAIVRRLPLVVSVHSGDAARRLESAPARARRLSRAVLRRAAKVLCVNSSIATAIESFVGRGNVVVVPPHSVEFSPVVLPAEIAEFVREHRPAIVCIGLFEPTYGFDEAIRALPKIREGLPRAGLMLVGDPRDSAAARELIDRLGLASVVSICGNMSHEECLTLMSSAALFLRPTLYDGDSLSVREALALGIPVVATQTDFRPEGVVLYRQDQPGALASTVSAVLEQSRPQAERAAARNENLESVRQIYMDAIGRRS